MKYTNLRAFEKHLEEASPLHFSSLYMILDKDPFSRKLIADKLISMILPEAKNRDLGRKIFEADKDSIDDILRELESPSFFSERRVIILNHAEKLSKASVEKLEPYFTHLPPSTYLVFSCSALSAVTNFYKKVEKAGVVLDIPEEKPWEKEKSLQSWMAAYSDLQNKSIDPQTCHYLTKQIGIDQALLQQELDKLICYIGEKSVISIQDAAAICISVPLETIWKLGEAIFKKDAPSAMRISKDILDEGTPFLAFLRQLRNQFQTELEIACILDRNGSPAEITEQFPYMKGNILSQHMQMARGYGLKKLKEGILFIDAAEFSAKKSVAETDIINELLITHLIYGKP
jgi:DNA polymerase-3 subunit delta